MPNTDWSLLNPLQLGRYAEYIPSATWESPNEVFVDRKYDKPGQKNAPEYGINISQKTMIFYKYLSLKN